MLDRNSLRALALAGQLGFAIAGPLLICGGGGFWLGQQWGLGSWLGIAGLLFGLIAAGYSIYQLAVAIPARKPKGDKPGPVEQDDDEDEPLISF